MKLIVWNSQGAKWDIAYDNWVEPALWGTDVVLCLVEAGHAPWVKKEDIYVNKAYGLETDTTWFDKAGAFGSAFCTGVTAGRNKALWIPWMKNMDPDVVNLRCSLGAGCFPYKLPSSDLHTYHCEDFLRPTVRLRLGTVKDVVITIIVVHMISGYQTLAKEQLLFLVKMMSQIIPEGTAGIVVGDMNVNLLTAGAYVLPKYWRPLNTGVATQQSGGELDYALLYDPNQRLTDASVTCLEKYKTGSNTSDHSVLQYTLDL